MQKALPVFTSAFGPEDEFALYLFHTYARRVLGFSRDRDTVARRVPCVGVDACTGAGRPKISEH